MKKAFLECTVSFVMLAAVVTLSGGWLISRTSIHPWALLVLGAAIWALIGWLRMGFVERDLQLMLKFLAYGVAGVLASKAQKLDDLYGEEIRNYKCLREDPKDKAGLLKQLRWTKRSIRKAKPDFWRTVRFALENKLIKHKPDSYRDLLPKKNQTA